MIIYVLYYKTKLKITKPCFYLTIYGNPIALPRLPVRGLLLTHTKTTLCFLFTTIIAYGGIAPNQVIARSEFEVHREMYKEWM